MNDYDPSVLVSQPEQETAASEKEVATAETAEVETPEADEATPAEDSAKEGEAPQKPKKSAKERIDEITWEKHEALREAEAVRAENERLAAQLAQLSAYIPPQVSEDLPPNPMDYEYGDLDVNYIRDVTRFEIKQEQKAEAERKAVIERHQTQAQRVASFLDKAKEVFPNGPGAGLATLMDPKTAVHEDVVDLLTSSDMGPQLGDYLGSNLSELARINALPAHLKGFEIARIEARLSAPETKPLPKPKAPQPPESIPRGTAGRFAVSPDTDDFSAFEKSYMR